MIMFVQFYLGNLSMYRVCILLYSNCILFMFINCFDYASKVLHMLYIDHKYVTFVVVS